MTKMFSSLRKTSLEIQRGLRKSLRNDSSLENKSHGTTKLAKNPFLIGNRNIMTFTKPGSPEVGPPKFTSIQNLFVSRSTSTPKYDLL